MTLRDGHIHVDRWRFSMDPLLPVVLLLMAWVLSERYYPDMLFLENRYEYWLLGGFTALFITISIIVHELGHTLAARYFHIPIQRIHLYLFGGMAELQYRPQRAGQEWWIAAAGPLASFLLAGISWMIYALLITPEHLPYYFFKFIALINFMIGVFNLLPIFPLDGGRLARAAIWKLNGNFIRASRLTNKTGSFFIGLLVLLTLVDYFYIDSGYSLIAGILAMYMFYTYHTGRSELKYSPEPDDLIFTIDHNHDTGQMIRDISEQRPGLIQECIIPVLGNGHVEMVIDGNRLDDESSETHDFSIARPVSYGDFLDTGNPDSYAAGVEFNAEWVPVLSRGLFVGMCDAREMRFWLIQNHGTDRLKI